MPMASTTICLQTSSEHVLLLVLQYLSTNSHISLRDLTLPRLPKMMGKRSSFFTTSSLRASNCSVLRGSNGYDMTSTFLPDNNCTLEYVKRTCGGYLYSFLSFLAIMFFAFLSKNFPTLVTVETALFFVMDMAMPLSTC